MSCFSFLFFFSARIGALKYPYQPWSNGGQDVEEIKVSKVKMHPQYSSYTYDFDLAVLKLAEPSTIPYANIDDSDKQISDNYVGKFRKILVALQRMYIHFVITYLVLFMIKCL